MRENGERVKERQGESQRKAGRDPRDLRWNCMDMF